MAINIKLTPEEKSSLILESALIHIHNELLMRSITNIKDIPLQNRYKHLFKELWDCTRKFNRHIQDGLKSQAENENKEQIEFIEMFDADCDEIHEKVLQYIKEEVQKKKKSV